MATDNHTIGQLDQLVLSLPSEQQARFQRIFQVVTSTGALRAPAPMRPWLRDQFGSLEAVESQKIVRVINRVTLEDALFNPLRSQRPLQTGDGTNLEALAQPTPDDQLEAPLEHTPEDVFGRVKGAYSISASNVAKIDGFSGLIIFDHHSPLQFTREMVSDYFRVGEEWARKAHAQDPSGVYYFFVWNCLWPAGASQVHGHAQTMLARQRHYGKVEHLRISAQRYREATQADYFDDLYQAHADLGLGFDARGVRTLAYLTPTKEKEVLILADSFSEAMVGAIYGALACFRDRLGVVSFNLALYQKPIGPVAEDWSGFPALGRIVDRGDLNNRTSDIGGMELYAASVVASDPFFVAEKLRSCIIT